MKRLILVLLVSVMTLGMSTAEAYSQSSEPTKKESRKERKAAEEEASRKLVQELLQKGEFLFVAERMDSSLPRASRNLSAGYQVSFTKDKIVSYLPFAGKMSNVAYGSSNSNPMDFTSTDFTFTEKKGDKSVEYVYEIDPDGADNHFKFYVEVWYKNGSMAVRVVQSRGDSISYNGRIEPITKK